MNPVSSIFSLKSTHALLSPNPEFIDCLHFINPCPADHRFILFETGFIQASLSIILRLFKDF